MAVDILSNAEGDHHAFYDDTSDVAFGPVMVTTRAGADAFLDMIVAEYGDPRNVREDDLVELWHRFSEANRDSEADTVVGLDDLWP